MLCCLHIQAVDAKSEYIYAPVDALAVNAKTVFVTIPQDLTWNDAVAICKSRFSSKGGTLAKVDSAEANRKLTDQTAVTGQNGWIGLYWKSAAGSTTLQWSDRNCTGFDARSYQNFGRQESIFSEQDRCYYVEKDTGLWRKAQCRSKFHAICEYLDFSTTACSNKVSPYEPHAALFYTLAKTDADAQECMDDCTNTQGCFLTYPSDKMCFMGVVHSSGVTYVRNRCFEVSVESSKLTFTTIDEVNPRDCQKVNQSAITGVNATPYSNNASSGGTCSAKMVTEIVISTVVALTTTTDVQMLTTTVTDVQTYTTFGVSTTTTVNFLTTTTTIMSTVAMTVQPECTEAKIVMVPTTVTEISVSIQPTTTTYISVDIQPTTVTYISVSIQPTTNTYISYLNCETQTTDVSSSCPVQTVTTERITYVTPTMSDCHVTLCPRETSLSGTMKGSRETDNLETMFATTVTEFDCTATTIIAPIVKTVETTIFGIPITITTRVLNTIPVAVADLSNDCGAMTTMVAKFLTTTETWTATQTCDIISSTSDCPGATTIVKMLTTTETLPVYNMITQTLPADCAAAETTTITTTVANMLTTTEIWTATPIGGVITQIVTAACSAGTTDLTATETWTATATCDVVTPTPVTDCTATITSLAVTLTTTEVWTAIHTCDSITPAASADCTPATVTVANMLTTTETYTSTPTCDAITASVSIDCPSVPPKLSVLTTTETWTAKCDEMLPTVAADCPPLTASFSVLTTTETWTATATCDLTTPASCPATAIISSITIANLITTTETLTAIPTCDFNSPTIITVVDCVEATTVTTTVGGIFTTETSTITASCDMIASSFVWNHSGTADDNSVFTTTETLTATPTCDAITTTVTADCATKSTDGSTFTKREMLTATPTCGFTTTTVLAECGVTETNAEVQPRSDIWKVAQTSILINTTATDHFVSTQTTALSVVTTTETWTAIPRCDVTKPNLVADCTSTQTSFSVLTKTETLRATSSCDVLAATVTAECTWLPSNITMLTKTWTATPTCDYNMATNPGTADCTVMTTTSVITTIQTPAYTCHENTPTVTLVIGCDTPAMASNPTPAATWTATPTFSLDCTTQAYDNVRTITETWTATQANENVLTITETWTAIQACDVVASTPSLDVVRTTNAIVIPNVSQSTEQQTSGISTPSSLAASSVSDSDVRQELDGLHYSLIHELLVPTANLSSRRRLKESAEDHRLTARIPGIFACCLLGCSFGLLVLLDLSVLVRELSKLGNLIHTSNNASVEG
ncbi:hypothetical protein BsWGS_01282 [Bradybaena similaris]